MTTERLLMRQVREVLRLKYEQRLPHRAIARACGTGLGTVSDYCRRAREAGLTWPLPADWDDGQLEARLSFAKRASDPCGEGLTGPQDAETADGSVDDGGRSEGESRVGNVRGVGRARWVTPVEGRGPGSGRARTSRGEGDWREPDHLSWSKP
jgi:hypothetical protein